jgi:LmbE family N-acetylglucosaminyl deacetylase
MRSSTILLVVSHPDDEALWLGGLLSGWSQFDGVRMFVVALTGAHTVRAGEFEKAHVVAGYTRGVVLGREIPPWSESLPPVAPAVEEALRRFELAASDIDIVITHSPYGDEHRHPHHREAYREVLAWARRRQVPFGYASCLAMPFFHHRPLLRSVYRKGALQIVGLDACRPAFSWPRRTFDPVFRHYLTCPKYFVRYQIDTSAKMNMLSCYQSIDIAQHIAGYAMTTSAIESVYVFQDAGLQPFVRLLRQMDAPAGPDLFTLTDTRFRFKSLARRLAATLKRPCERRQVEGADSSMTQAH